MAVLLLGFAQDHKWWFLYAALLGLAAVPFTIGYVWNERWRVEGRSSAKLFLLVLLLSQPVGDLWRLLSGVHSIAEWLRVSVYGALMAATVLGAFYLGLAGRTLLGRRALNRE